MSPDQPPRIDRRTVRGTILYLGRLVLGDYVQPIPTGEPFAVVVSRGPYYAPAGEQVVFTPHPSDIAPTEVGESADTLRLLSAFLSLQEKCIVRAVLAGETKSDDIARRANVAKSQCRTLLANLVDRGLLASGRRGYAIELEMREWLLRATIVPPAA
jgi:hypothetical protein